MTQSVVPHAKKKGTWFWIGVSVLSLSTIIWLVAITGLLFGWEEDTALLIGTALLLTAIPTGLGIACIMTRSVPTERSPWGWGTLFTVSFLAGFAAGGIIAGINWHRMGKHNLVWPTIIGAIVALTLFVLFLPETVSNSTANFISLVPAWGLYWWQKGSYRAWKESHPEAQRAGWQMPLLMIMVTLAFVIGVLLVEG